MKMLLQLCKQLLSYDTANTLNIGDFFALTWSIYAGPVTYNICNMGTRDLPDMYAWNQRAEGNHERNHIRQSQVPMLQAIIMHHF